MLEDGVLSEVFGHHQSLVVSAPGSVSARLSWIWRSWSGSLIFVNIAVAYIAHDQDQNIDADIIQHWELGACLVNMSYIKSMMAS